MIGKYTFFYMLCALTSLGQIRHQKLVLKPKEVYEIKGSDIIVVDTLIMQDSSKIILNKLKPDNFIHAKSAIFYRGAVIDGHGVHGLDGRKGKPGVSPMTPCTDGGTGTMGTEGTNGGSGTNVFLYFNTVTLKGTLTIDVAGGDGGEGGNGGAGGGGGPGTRLCNGGNGGSGGNGANGGNGGNSGSVTFTSPIIHEIRMMLNDKIFVRNYGGNLGLGADGGPGGSSGLNPVGKTDKDGKQGHKGLKGKSGVPGKPGSINFQEK